MCMTNVNKSFVYSAKKYHKYHLLNHLNLAQISFTECSSYKFHAGALKKNFYCKFKKICNTVFVQINYAAYVLNSFNIKSMLRILNTKRIYNFSKIQGYNVIQSIGIVSKICMFY